MKTLATMAVLAVVLGLCLPSYGEILVYKLTNNSTYYRQEAGQWQVEKGAYKRYLVLEVDYAQNTVTRAEAIEYETWPDRTKHINLSEFTAELVRVEAGTTIRWVVMVKQTQGEGEQATMAGFHMLTGLARDRNIGTDQKQEAANKLTGYNLDDTAQEDGRSIGIGTLSATLYPAWTYWANGANKGNQDLDTTVQMIVDYLEARGYSLDES
jgi:hypothetical protein